MEIPMTTVLQDIPVTQLQAQAAAARPGHAIATVISSVFVAIGWLIGKTVTSTVFCGLAVRYGYRLGRGRDPVTGQPFGIMPAPQPVRA
jgi:hypothetical protein